ncbi:MAG: carbamate kinase [Haloplanus sp.]
MTRTVLALGGNALVERGAASYADQRDTVRRTVDHLDPLRAGDRDVVFTHGNGPQVGNRLLEQEAAATETPTLPLDVLVAETQGQLGYLLANALDARWDETALAISTRAVVDGDDPAFESPSKPVGPWYTEAEANRKPFETAAVGSGERPYRRVVASPRPRRIVERDRIDRLVGRGPVICCGGGGIPVVDADDGFEERAAVIDKDYTSAVLGCHLDARELVFLTDVPCAYLDYGTHDQRPIETVDPETLQAYIDRGEFGEGSMRPKAEACVAFVESGGERAVITRPADVEAALAGTAGTRVRRA